MAFALPDISSTPSSPRPSVSSLTRWTKSSFETSMTASAFILRASSSRYGETSLAMTWQAPAARATPIANRPIGPQPVTAIRQAERSPEKAVCTAFPSGSMMLCTSSGTFSGARQAFTAGATAYSAKPPSTSTPRILVFWQTCPLPVRQAVQCPQTMWLSNETRSPSRNSVTPAPRAMISPTNSCPIVTGGWRRFWLQASHS